MSHKAGRWIPTEEGIGGRETEPISLTRPQTEKKHIFFALAIQKNENQDIHFSERSKKVIIF